MSRLLKNITGMSLVLLLSACAKEQIDNPRGNLDSIRESFSEQKAVGLRCLDAVDGTLEVTLTYGAEESVELDFQAYSTAPLKSERYVDIVPEPSYVKTYSELTGIDYQFLPAMFYRFSEGAQMQIGNGCSVSAVNTLKIFTHSKYGDSLKKGRYLLPLQNGEGEEPILIDIVVREKFKNDYPLFEDEDKMFFVFYLNTGRFDPRLVTDFYLQETRQDWEAAIGNILNLRKSIVTPDEDNNPVLVLYPDLKYVLENRDTYILPIQESGRKVCLCIEGGGKGLGFCNLTEDQIESLTDQIVRTVDKYKQQGVNLWDRGTNYGLEGMPEVNTTSYPKFIKKLREKLGGDRLLTLVDFEEPTANFWEKAACGGIEVGRYIDYAWSGYNKEQDGIQIIDPYHQGMEGVSTQYPRKPILGLSPKKYGCVNVPWFGMYTPGGAKHYDSVTKWECNSCRQNAIFVYEDISSDIQGPYEQCTDPGDYLKILLNARGLKPRKMFQLNPNKIRNDDPMLPEYGKWLKDW